MAFYNVMKLEYHDFIQYRIYEKPVEYDVKADLKKEDVSFADSGECIDVEARKERSMYVSLNRTKQSVYSLAYNNKWDWFVTLTFSDKKVDRYDYSEIIKKTRNWFNNVKKRFAPDLKYILIPEPHKDGAYHLHGLLANCGELQFVDSGRVVDHGKSRKKNCNNADLPTIYNIANWKFGFSTATKVQSNAKCVSYMTKYITKDLCVIAQKRRRYLASNNLDRVEREYLNIPRDQIDNFLVQAYLEDRVDYVKTQKIPEAGQHINYVTIKKG